MHMTDGSFLANRIIFTSSHVLFNSGKLVIDRNEGEEDDAILTIWKTIVKLHNGSCFKFTHNKWVKFYIFDGRTENVI